MPASSFSFTSLDWMLRSSVSDAPLNRVSWNSRKAGSIPSSSSSPVQPGGGTEREGGGSEQGVKGKGFRGCAGLTKGVEGAPVHGCSIFGVKEQRGNLSAGQQVGVALRQREPLQLVGQRRHVNCFLI